VNSLHEEMPCGIVDMIKLPRKDVFLIKVTSGIMDSFINSKTKGKKCPYGGAPEHDMWKGKRLEEEHPCLDDDMWH
jgi:hypothetical protein